MECFGVGTGGKAQLVLGLGTVKGVVALQVVDRKLGQHGLCALFGGQFFHLLCGKVGEGKGKVELAALAAGILFKHPAHFLQGDFIIAQDVAFTLAALVGSSNGACGQVTHIHHVEAARHADGHFTVQDLGQGAGGLADGRVVGADDAAGVDNAGVQARVGGIQYLLGGHGLAAAVPAYHLFLFIGDELVHFPDGLPGGQLRNSTGGGNVHELPAFRVVLGGGKHILGAAHIHGDQLLAVTRVDGDHAGTVDADALAALGDVEEGFAVLGTAQIALKNLDLSGQILAGRIPLEDEGPDVLPPFDQLRADVDAQETGRAGQQINGVDVHIHFLPLFSQSVRYGLQHCGQTQTHAVEPLRDSQIGIHRVLVDADGRRGVPVFEAVQRGSERQTDAVVCTALGQGVVSVQRSLVQGGSGHVLAVHHGKCPPFYV